MGLQAPKAATYKTGHRKDPKAVTKKSTRAKFEAVVQ